MLLRIFVSLVALSSIALAQARQELTRPCRNAQNHPTLLNAPRLLNARQPARPAALNMLPIW